MDFITNPLNIVIFFPLVGVLALLFMPAAAHQRRGVVKLHQQRAFRGGAVFFGEIGNQPGSRQGTRGFRALAG